MVAVVALLSEVVVLASDLHARCLGNAVDQIWAAGRDGRSLVRSTTLSTAMEISVINTIIIENLFRSHPVTKCASRCRTIHSDQYFFFFFLIFYIFYYACIKV